MAGIWQDYGWDMAGLWQGYGRPDSSSMIYFSEFADPILNILFQ